MLAGTGKISPLQTLVVTPSLILSKEFSLGLVLLEFGIGGVTASLILSKLCRKLLLFLFSAYLVVLSIKMWQGKVHCNYVSGQQ